MLFGPEASLELAEVLLLRACSQFQTSCVQEELQMDACQAAAFSHPAAAATAKRLQEKFSSIGERHRVLVEVDLNTQGAMGTFDFGDITVRVRP